MLHAMRNTVMLMKVQSYCMQLKEIGHGTSQPSVTY